MTPARRRWTRTALVVAFLLTVGACGNSATPNSLDPSGSEAERIAGLWWLAFGVAAAVYLIVGGLVVFGSLRKGGDELDDHSRRKEQIVIAVGGVLIPFMILLFFAAVTVDATTHLRKHAPGSIDVTVTGKRWWWDVRYPDYRITSANEIHLPVGQPVHLRLLSDNVIHSFWVPELAGKEDMIPGQPNQLDFTPKKPGRYLGLCAEYCGEQHSGMRFIVFVETAAGFTRWVTQQQQAVPLPSSENEALGQQVFLREACSGCHTISGTTAHGTLGPNLTAFGGRATIAAGVLPNTSSALAKWIRDPQGIKPGNLMPRVPMSARDVDAVVAYLLSLR